MPFSERIYTVVPDSNTPLFEGFRVAPNEGTFPPDATIYVDTEDDHEMIFEIVPKGPNEKDYLISLVSTEPPIYTDTLLEKEVYVKDDILKQGAEFRLDSAYPILSQTAFKAARIYSNVETTVLPPTQSIPVIAPKA